MSSRICLAVPSTNVFQLLCLLTGDKIASSIVAQTANVPTLPWSGSSLTIPDYYLENGADEDIMSVDSRDSKSSETISVPDYIYKQGCVDGVENALQVGIHLQVAIGNYVAINKRLFVATSSCKSFRASKLNPEGCNWCLWSEAAAAKEFHGKTL